MPPGYPVGLKECWQSMHFPDLSYDCVQCGKSCGGWRVLVDDAARQRLQEADLARKAVYEPS